MIVEPVINMEEFLKDVDDGMSAYNLQDKYILTPRQYRRIMRNVQRKDGFALKKSRVQPYTHRSKFNEPYITLKKDGWYIVRKDRIYYGQYSTLEMAKLIKKALMEVDWDKSKLNKIRAKFGLKPMRYNYVKDKGTE